MTAHLSDKLIKNIGDELGIKISTEQHFKLQKTIRDYFIRIHNEAREATVIACNKKQYNPVEFYDK